MRSLLSLAGPSTLLISLIAPGFTPKPARASLDFLDSPFTDLSFAPHDYIDANGLLVDASEYSWGGYAKKRNTAVRATKPGVLHHPRGKHGQLLSRQVVMPHPSILYFANIFSPTVPVYSIPDDMSPGRRVLPKYKSL
jgi:hypothetical protein